MTDVAIPEYVWEALDAGNYVFTKTVAGAPGEPLRDILWWTGKNPEDAPPGYELLFKPGDVRGGRR